MARYEHIEEIPASEKDWDVAPRGAAKLASTLAGDRDLALLFRRIATVDVRAPVSDSVDELRWSGPLESFGETCEQLMTPRLQERAKREAVSR